MTMPANHPFFEYIDWQVRDAERKKLQAAYDTIVAAGFEDQLKLLFERVYDAGVESEVAANAGPDY